MNHSRRSFFEQLIAAGLLTNAFSSTAFSREELQYLLDAEEATAQTSNEPHDADQFWKNFFRSIEPGAKGSKPSLEAQDRRVQYLHYGKDGLRYVNDVKPEELLDYDGDVMISASLGQFRPSVADNELLHAVKSSQLRVDFVQTKSFMNLLAPMAWAALAVFYHDKPGKLPSLDALGYKAPNYVNGIQRVLLPGGTGKFAVNVATVKPESTLHKVLRAVVPAVMATAPVLNLPAISIPVLKTFTELYLGPEVERRTSFLLNSLPAQWFATQQARHDPDMEIESLPLMSGNYVMVPQAHAEELGKELPKLEWLSGYLVPRGGPTTESLPTRAQQVIPGVTYVSMRLNVTKVQPAPAKNNAEKESDSDSEKPPTKKGSTPSKPTNPPAGSNPPRKKP